MFIDRLLNQGPMPVLEQQLNFTEAREQLLGDDIANLSNPDYQNKDLSAETFEQQLRNKVEEQATAVPGSVNFDQISSEVENPNDGILFHDGNNRSTEQLMTDNAKNTLMHNLVVELLRQQYQTMTMALKGQVS
jgi:flagellar basal-body rod protein FlgB